MVLVLAPSCNSYYTGAKQWEARGGEIRYTRQWGMTVDTRYDHIMALQGIPGVNIYEIWSSIISVDH